MNLPFSTRVLIAALTGTTLASLLAVVIYFHNGKVAELQEKLNHQEEIVRRLRVTQTQIANLESDERGYLLSGEQEALKVFEAATLALEASLDETESLMVRYGRPVDYVKAIREIKHRWVDAAKTYDVAERLKLKAKEIELDEFLQKLSSRPGLKIGQELRAQTQALTDQEFKFLSGLLIQMGASTHTNKLWLLIGTPLCLLISIFLIFVTIRKPLRLLAETVDGLSETSYDLEDAGDTLVLGSSRYREVAQELTNSANSTRTAMQTIDDLTNESAQRALSCGNAANIVQRTTQDGTRLMRSLSESIDSMHSLKERLVEFNQIFENIERKASSINDIAFQSKVLSFNASIEASGAGKFGTSFAIIASEIAKLSETSAQLATDVMGLMEQNRASAADIVEALQTSVNNTAFIGEQAVVSFDAISVEVYNIQERIKGIIELTQAQKRSVEHLQPAVESQNAATSVADTLTAEIIHSAEELREQSQQLNGILGEVHRLVL